MALKFRRGTTAQKSGLLAFGEPYVNTTLGTLQIGLDTGDVTLSQQIDSSSNVVVNSLSASSFVSASKLHITGNGEIKGNLTIGGNITIGDQNSDTINVVANLSSSLIPETTNAFDLGSVTKAWKDLYISTASIKIVDTSTNTVVGTLSSNASGDLNISGQLSASSIAGLGVIQTFSSSLNQRLDSIQTTSSSLLSRVNSIETTTASFGQAFQTYSSSINAYTASNNTTNNTQNSRLNSLEATTASLNTLTASISGRVNSLETTSASLVSFSSSVAAGIQLTGSNVTVIGNLQVKGTTTTVNSTTIQLDDNVIALNAAGTANGGIIVRDATGGTTTSGSLLWDVTNDYWKAGPNGTEDRIVLATEFNSFTSSHEAAQNADNLRLNALQSTTASLNTYTASNDSINNAQNVRLNSIENSTASLNSYTSSNQSNLSTIGGRVGALETESGSIRTAFNSYTSSTNTDLSVIHSTTASLNSETSSINSKLNLLEIATSSLNTYTASNDSSNTTQNNRLSSLESATSSLYSYTSSNNTIINTLQTATASLNSYTASNNSVISALNTSTASLNSFTSSINTTIKSKLDAEGVVSGSLQITISSTTGYSTYSSSVATFVDAKNNDLSSSIATATSNLSSSIATTDLSQNNRLDTIESRYVTTGSNSFVGNQNVTGSLYISQDLIVYGSSSITYVTSSQLNVQTSFISVNVNEPSERFGGLKVYDSGSSNATASLAWDSLNNRWIYQNASGSSYNGAMLIMGPRNTGSLGDEVALTSGRIARSAGGDHIVDSIISELNGNAIAISGSLVVTGSITSNGLGVLSGSSQVFSEISGDIVIASNGVATIQPNSVVLGTDTTGDYVGSLVAGSGITLSNNSGEGATPTIALTNNAITIAGQSTSLGGSVTAATIGTAIGAFSGSSQVDHNSTTNYDANKHVDHTTVSISAGIGLSGGGTIASTRTLSIDTATTATVTGSQTLTNKTIAAGSNTISGLTNTNLSGTAGITNANLANSTITIAGTSTSLGDSISAATILSGTSVVSGSGQIDVASTTGDIALGSRTSGNYVASLVAGTNITLTNNTGEGATPTIALTNNTISGVSLGSNLNALTIGTGLSGTSYNGSAGVTIANTGVLSITSNTGLSSNVSATGAVTITNTGVTSITAGSGISRDVSTGGVTITNTGVTSNVAGTGVSVRGATGAVTISIGQAVATSSNVQFNSIGIGMAASATAGRIDATNDIVAYSSSDKRFKDNIKPIEKPLEKISKISGNTFDWKEENKIEHGYEGEDVGVIAQEIEVVLPQIVTTRDNGYKAVKYDKLVALLIEGIKEQQIQINDMKVEIENLKKQKGL